MPKLFGEAYGAHGELRDEGADVTRPHCATPRKQGSPAYLTVTPESLLAGRDDVFVLPRGVQRDLLAR